VVPTQSSYATDGVAYRSAGIPTHGAAGVFIEDSEEFAHGLNERVRVGESYRGLIFWDALIRTLGAGR
jgi:acetylornithine deacetylase/succinyl-diaminopimelate desuccinylase-like protein